MEPARLDDLPADVLAKIVGRARDEAKASSKLHRAWQSVVESV